MYIEWEGRVVPSILTFINVNELSPKEYLMWRYILPAIIISYGAMVGTVDHQLMRMALYYKLSRPHGLFGDQIFLRDPVNYFTYLRQPIRAGPLV
jgi:hypothetical protein